VKLPTWWYWEVFSKLGYQDQYHFSDY